MFASTPKPAATPRAAWPDLNRHVQRRLALHPGLSLHADDTVDHCDFTASGHMESGLRILVLLEGAADVSYGERRLLLGGAGGARASEPSAILVNLTRPEPFTRRLRKGRHARRVSVSLDAHWLAQATDGAQVQDAVGEFMRRHLALHAFRPSPRLAALAARLAAAPSEQGAPGQPPLLHRLHTESRALAFTAEALAALLPSGGGAQPPASLRPREVRRMQQLHDFLRSDAALGLSVQAIARQVGMHPNTMQRHFRTQYGTSVVECMRQSRLQRARHALEHEGLSVAQAAELAGYTSAANFATAFRRQFGVPPKWVRLGQC
ncbi:MAG: AraC family transcriptional regulator [Pseudomonadota bacterium]|nr:AraC family transcriptional regulator [Pseudomonadota bacterium]